MHDQSRHRSMDTLRMFALQGSRRRGPPVRATTPRRFAEFGAKVLQSATERATTNPYGITLSRSVAPACPHQHRFLACQSRNLCCQGFKRSLAALLRGQIERGIASIVWERQHLGK